MGSGSSYTKYFGLPLQAIMDVENKAWTEYIHKSQRQGPHRRVLHVPFLIVDTLTYIKKVYTQNPSRCAGLLTKSPSTNKVDQLESEFSKFSVNELVKETTPWIKHLETKLVEPVVAMSLIKRFLLHLPKRLFPDAYVARLDEAACHPHNRPRAELLKALFSELPVTYTSNYTTILYLINFCHSITEWDESADPQEIGEMLVPLLFGDVAVEEVEVGGPSGTDSLENVCIDKALHNKARPEFLPRANVLALCIRHPHIIDASSGLARLCGRCHMMLLKDLCCPACPEGTESKPFTYPLLVNPASTGGAGKDSQKGYLTPLRPSSPVMMVDVHSVGESSPTRSVLAGGAGERGIATMTPVSVSVPDIVIVQPSTEQQQPQQQPKTEKEPEPLKPHDTSTNTHTPPTAAIVPPPSSNTSVHLQANEEVGKGVKISRKSPQTGRWGASSSDSEMNQSQMKNVTESRGINTSRPASPRHVNVPQQQQHNVTLGGHESLNVSSVQLPQNTNSNQGVTRHPDSGVATNKARSRSRSPVPSVPQHPNNITEHNMEMKSSLLQQHNHHPHYDESFLIRFGAMEQRLTTLTNENSELRVALNSTKTELAGIRLQLSQHDDAPPQHTMYVAAIAGLQEENSILRKEISHVAQQTIEHLRDLSTRVTKLETKALMNKNGGMSSTLQNIDPTQILVLNAEVQNLRDWMGKLTTDLQRQNHRSIDLESDVKMLHTTMSTMQADVAALQTTQRAVLDDRADTLSLEAKLDDLRVSMSARDKREKTFVKQIHDMEHYQALTHERLKVLSAGRQSVSNVNVGVSKPAGEGGAINQSWGSIWGGGSASTSPSFVPVVGAAHNARKELMKLYS